MGIDGDEDLRAAMAAGATFALVRVASIARERVGTRSQVVGYACEVVRAIEDGWPVSLTLKHFGLPLLETGRAYLVGAIDNRRHHGGRELRFAALAEGSPEDEVAAFLARRATVMARPQ
jgi:hypothetical protein